MNTDFLDAHQRHWDDAEQLFSDARWANADHLFGMSAECGLKRLMIAFGMPHTAQHPSNRGDRVHIDSLWERYEAYRSGQYLGANYGLPDEFEFSDWRAEQRYSNQSCFDEGRASEHRSGALAVKNLINNALLDGVIE
ncbi:MULTISPECIES: SAM-dependent methyltransferase [Xanthomonas]|uniref:SAM-dependent methyltransferase n=1 Tax=Xanthomonas TaxID=338 RepID=UPI0009BC8E01|nr:MULTISPECIES: SAM-dependent methyltransferase [Xanthomonas]MBO9850764.1 hypothetical protein [Xanthomonas phaseoli pv. dieffenbachiae]OQP41997.1 SAM-dependent methyltransferase [Xanthomonas euvesicatoria]